MEHLPIHPDHCILTYNSVGGEAAERVPCGFTPSDSSDVSPDAALMRRLLAKRDVGAFEELYTAIPVSCTRWSCAYFNKPRQPKKWCRMFFCNCGVIPALYDGSRGPFVPWAADRGAQPSPRSASLEQ